MGLDQFCEEMETFVATMKKVAVVGNDIWQAQDDPELFSVEIHVIAKSSQYLVTSRHQVFYNCMTKEFVDVSATEPNIQLTPTIEIKGHDVFDYISDECVDYDIEDKALLNQANRLVNKLLGLSGREN